MNVFKALGKQLRKLFKKKPKVVVKSEGRTRINKQFSATSIVTTPTRPRLVLNEYIRRRLFVEEDGSNGNPPVKTLMQSQRRSRPALQEIQDHSSSENAYYLKVANNPDMYFDQIVQLANQFVEEAEAAVRRFKHTSMTEEEIVDTEARVAKTVVKATNIADQLLEYVDEISAIRSRGMDSVLSPRVVGTIQARKTAVDRLLQSIRNVKKDLHGARELRDRKNLFNEWKPFDRSLRRPRDAEEIMSESTERLMNSKRILADAVHTSSGTLGSLATSSQSIQGNQEELQTQSGSISSARSLLQKYGRRISTDKLLIWVAFIFFSFVVLMVCYRRLFF